VQLASNLESKIEVVNHDSELSDAAIEAMARLLIGLATEEEDEYGRRGMSTADCSTES
jgi:hypothetical protein